MVPSQELLAGSFPAWHRPVVIFRLATAFFLVVALTPALAFAQGQASGDQAAGRADLLEQERRAKAEMVMDPQRTSVEKGIHRFNSLTPITRWATEGSSGFHFAGGSFPAGAGFAYGIGFTDLALGSAYADSDLPNRFDVDAVAAYSTSGYLRVGGRVEFHNLAGSRFGVGVGAQYFEFPQEDFFGIGPDSQESARSNYLLQSPEIGVDAWWEAGGFSISAGLFYLQPRTGSGTDSLYPSTEDVFDPSTLPGFGDEPDFLRVDGSVHFDWRDNPAYPRSGGFYGVLVSDFRDRNLDAFDFRRFEVDLQQYVPLLHKRRVLALRANVVLTDADAGNDVPFYYMPNLGGAHELRGFREFRFTDRNKLLLTAEYRWEAWWALDVALFVDAGKVTADSSDLDFHDLETSYGVGFRFHSTDSFALRLDLAKSREGFIPFLRYENVF